MAFFVWSTAAGAGLVGSDADRLYVALIRYSNELRLLNQDERTLRMEGFHRSDKVYAALCPTSDEVEFEAGGHKVRFRTGFPFFFALVFDFIRSLKLIPHQCSSFEK